MVADRAQVKSEGRKATMISRIAMSATMPTKM
jgi:hypothetical protein